MVTPATLWVIALLGASLKFFQPNTALNLLNGTKHIARNACRGLETASGTRAQMPSRSTQTRRRPRAAQMREAASLPKWLPKSPDTSVRALSSTHAGAATSVAPHSMRPYRLGPPRLLRPGDSPGKNTGVGGQALLQEIFLTQGSNRVSSVSCRGRRVLCHERHLGSPRSLLHW